MQMHNPCHPGEIIKEHYLLPLKLTVTQIAKDLHISRKTFSDIVNKHAGISPEMALKLAKAFNTTPELWINMQRSYDLWHAQQKIKAQIKKIKPYPTRNTQEEDLARP